VAAVVASGRNDAVAIVTDQSYESESAFPPAVKRIAVRVAIAACAVWLLLIAAHSCAKATARDYEAEGRVVWAHEVEGEWRAPAKPRQSGTRGWSRDGVGIQLEGRAEPIEYTRPRPSKLSDFAPGDRVRVSYSEGGFSVWRHFQVRNVVKLSESAP
jgi:hypothetical protein